MAVNSNKKGTRSQSYSATSTNKKSGGFGQTLSNIVLFIPRISADVLVWLLQGRGRELMLWGVVIWGILVGADSLWVANYGTPALIGFGMKEGTPALGVFDSLSILLTSRWSQLATVIGGSMVLQVVEGFTLHSITPEQAKHKLDHYSKYDVGEAPKGKIARASIAHTEYKLAGVKGYLLVALAGGICWVIDISNTFATHDPMLYWGDPGKVLWVAGMNMFRVILPETAIAILLKAMNKD